MTAVGKGDDIARELDAMSSQADVEAELAALKGVPAADPPEAIEAPVDGGAILQAQSDVEPETVEQKTEGQA